MPFHPEIIYKLTPSKEDNDAGLCEPIKGGRARLNDEELTDFLYNVNDITCIFLGFIKTTKKLRAIIIIRLLDVDNI